MFFMFDIVFFKSKKDQQKKKIERKVIIKKTVLDSIITYAKSWHPNEGILILSGQSKRESVIIDGLVVPPFSLNGPYYSGFSDYMLPFDLSYVGTVHSHPGGSNDPSLQDLNHYFGVVSIIIAYPYDETTIAAYDREGKNLEIVIS